MLMLKYLRIYKIRHNKQNPSGRHKAATSPDEGEARVKTYIYSGIIKEWHCVFNF